ncbi:M20 family peptidase [Lentibacillus sp. CBA3610]|nr:M20 family metallopeptidase [Lentibacillus sp. CBA3610]QKY71546.1 M20 family peptidase [Lentibacillus sp. CBA3610]
MREYIEKDFDAMLGMLEELVNIDSGSYNKEGIDQVGHVLKNKYEELGYLITEKEIQSFGNNLVIRHKEAVKPEILIVAHMDTVFPEGTAKERPFTIADGKAYGPGVIDMKSSLVMLYFSLKALIENNISGYENVEIVLNSDEEIGTESSRELIENAAEDKKCVLVLEPAREDGSIVSARRGMGYYSLKVKGKGAHSGIDPESGISAIEELAHKIIDLQALSEPEENLNVNVGLIKGGTSVNTVAPAAEAEIDVRISTVNQGKIIDEKIKKIGSKTTIKGTILDLTGGINRPPMEFNEGVQTLVKIIQHEGKKLGLDIKHTATGGGSDASFTAAMNVPTVDGMGPVGGKQHSKDEYLLVDSFKERTILFINVLKYLSKPTK